MDKFSSPEQVAEHLQVAPKTVRRWLRDGSIIGIKIGKSWRIHSEDISRFVDEQLFNARLERASRLHPEIEWTRGHCRECGSLMPEPKSRRHWVCSPECREGNDIKANAVVGFGTPEFVDCCATVIPPY